MFPSNRPDTNTETSRGFVIIRSNNRLSPHLAGDRVALGLVGTETLLATVLPVRAPGTGLVTVLSPPPGPAVTEPGLSLAPGVILAGADVGAVRAPAVEGTGPVTVTAGEAVLAVTGPV